MNRPSLPTSLNVPELRRGFLKQLQGLTWLNKLSQGFVGGLLPIVEGVFINLATGATDNNIKLLLWIAIGLLAIVHVALLAVILTFDQPLPQFLVEFDELSNEVKVARQLITQSESSGTQKTLILDTFTFCSVAAELSLLAVNDYLRNPGATKDSAFFDKILDPWVSGRKDLFWFSDIDDSYHNFALYLQDKTDLKLKIAWRKHGPSITPQNRDWVPGNGHVGNCFSTNSTKFCDIVSTGLLTNPASSRSEDSTYYRSFLAEPLRLNGSPVGVLIVTSGSEGVFQEDVHPIVLRLIARIIEATL